MNRAIGQSPVWAASKAEWAEAAQFFARVIAADASYISYGEMQTGLSPDGETWAPDLEQRFLAELGSFDGTRGLAIVRDASGKIVAAANVTWSFETAGAPFRHVAGYGCRARAAAGRTWRALIAVCRGRGGPAGRQMDLSRKREEQSSSPCLLRAGGVRRGFPCVREAVRNEAMKRRVRR